MSSFDTNSNTVSASFSDAFNCIVLEPSVSLQKAYGHQRSNSRRYLEFKINDVGGDPSKLWLGMAYYPYAADTGPEVAVMYGGASQNVNVTAGQLPSEVPPANNPFGTISSGQIWQFHVDFGGGTDQDGVQQVFTITDGLGNIFLPICGSFAVNGTWHTTILGPWICAARNFTGHLRPVVMREDHSTSAASVSLRVVTASFSLTIPTGAVAWGDGPQGGGASATEYPITWDATRVFGQLSLSDNGRICVPNFLTAEGSLSYYMVYSTALPTVASGAGRRVIEFRHGGGTNSFAPRGYGLVDASENYNFFHSTSYSGAYIFTSGGQWRGTLRTNSLTQSSYFSWPTGISTAGPGISMFVVDHDNQLIWGCNWAATSTEEQGLWAGQKSAALCSPYKSGGTDGATITDSVGLRWWVAFRADSTKAPVEINVGQKPFMSYPLMQGIKSYDGTRQTYGTGDSWKAGLSPSVSYSHSGFGIASRNPAITHIYSSGTGKSSGKKFFQVYHGYVNSPVGAMAYTTGIRPATMTTISNAAHTKNNLVWEWRTSNSLLCRYSTTATATISGPGGANAWWDSVAVDFDTGKVWFGLLNTQTGRNTWLNGGDPAAGTGEAATFTASTTMHAFTYLRLDGYYPNKTTIFVTEQGNLVDIPSGFTPWNDTPETSLTATPSGTSGSSLRVLWPYGVQT